MTNEEIILTSKTQISKCDCTQCKCMCKTPCLGTPIDIVNLIEAGYIDELSNTTWATGIVIGTHTKTVSMIQPKLNDNTGFCTFFEIEKGHCKLHNLGLKPLEGKLAYHNSRKYDNETIKNSPLLLIVAEWEKIENLKI